jgi:EF-P beta-lysylation protein EpmB
MSHSPDKAIASSVTPGITDTAATWREKLKQQVKVSANDWPTLRKHPDYDPSAENLFALRAPAAFLDSANESLLRQVLPTHREWQQSAGDRSDPVGDADSTVAAGVIHKYKGRVLLIANGLCAINCRYCFRRHFPYAQQYASHNNWQSAIRYLQTNTDVHEVILSGGDPLTLSTDRLRALSDQLQALSHIKTLRIHSRVPMVLPERITANLLEWLETLPLNKVLVIHANHSDEFSKPHREIFQALSQTGTMVLNQSVLLKGINDSAEHLIALSHTLFQHGILPYYLHQLDPVSGASHFAVDRQQAVRLHQQMQHELPGYLVPKLVQEIPQRPSKTLLF